MADELTDEQQNATHRWFAVQCNNQCWALTTTQRSAEQDAEMLHAAHAAAFHWSFAGETIHHMRAEQLLAHVHALLGMSRTALKYARACHRFFTAQETPDWELAFTHAMLAQAAAVAGETDLHGSADADALAAIEVIADADDRAIVEETFALVPAP